MVDSEVLKQARILQGLSTEQLEALVARSQITTYQCNQVVFEENSHGREIYIVLEGEVAVRLDPAKLGPIESGSIELREIRRIGPGESFGELALVSGRPRTATIVATRDNTKLLMIPPQIFDNVLQTQTILHNITRDITDELRSSNARMVESMLSGYYLTVLVDGLASGAYDCSPIIPLQKLVVIHYAESFILPDSDRRLSPTPEKEAIEISFFAEPAILQALAGPGSPSGAVIFNALFSIIRLGHISERIAEAAFHYEVNDGDDRRTGRLTVQKTVDGYTQSYTLEWQIKGAHYHAETRTTSAYLFLYVYDEATHSTASQAQQMIGGIAMPVQRHIYTTLAQQEQAISKLRVIMIHHRSHEVARTLQTMQELGYQIDSFIGIPYGDVNWDYITMLDYAANHNYLSLRLITHPTEPTQYQFDFRQSSFLDTQTEQDIFALYEDPAIAGDYMAAMQALAEYRLAQALRKCRQRGEKLLVYEDGGYIVGKIYEIYRNSDHPWHTLVKPAVDDGLIVGVVEVTVAGERKNLQVIQDNDGRALLPVLSNARSDIKAVYESIGVAEAVIHASATSFGRLGLPTFQTRRVAVIGGNGAIGTRLVEHFTMLHNSTANVFAVDLSDRPFSIEIDAASVPYAATRLKYRHLPRYVVADHCLPVILDVPYSERVLQPDQAAIAHTIRTFLAGGQAYQELALTNSFPLAEDGVRQLWEDVAQASGFYLVEIAPLPDYAGVRYCLHRGDTCKSVVLLAASTVLTFGDASRPIRDGVNTIVGSTGYSILSAKHLDHFFARPTAPQQVDELALISASSKDLEFRRAIDLLNMLLRLQTRAAVPTCVRLDWFAGLYKDEMSFLQGDDFAALKRLFAAPLTDQALETFMEAAPAVAGAMGLTGDNQTQWRERMADYITHKIRQRVTIRKEIRPDIGSIYHLVVDGQAKRVVLLADGLVVNFFARHEKGVKTEYIDPIVTMQVLSLVKLSTTSIAAGLYKMDTYLRAEDMATFWAAIDDNCRPLILR